MCSHGWFFHTGALKVSSDQYSADVPVWSAGTWTLQQFSRVKNQRVVWLKCRPSALLSRKDVTKELLSIQVPKRMAANAHFLDQNPSFQPGNQYFITWLLRFWKSSPKCKWIQNCAVVTDYYSPFLSSYWPYLYQISLGNTIHSQEHCFLLQFHNTRASFSASFE